MKIRKIGFTNHPIFGDLQLDFTDAQGKTINTIIIAGENGVGKSLLLNSVFEFSNLNLNGEKREEKRCFEIELSKQEIEILKIGQSSKQYFNNIDYVENIFKIQIDFNITQKSQALSI